MLGVGVLNKPVQPASGVRSVSDPNFAIVRHLYENILFKMWFCTLLTWLTLTPSGGEHFDATALYDLARHAVVRVEVADAHGRTSSASGVMVSADGLVATNYHVIQDGVSARLKLSNGDT